MDNIIKEQSEMEGVTKIKKIKTFSLFFITLIFILFLYLVTALFLKFNVSPDEELRYKIPLYIFQHGSLPVGTNKEVMLPYGNYSYAYYPQLLGGIISAFFMKIVSIFSHSKVLLLFAARWTSVLFGIITSIFVSLTVEKLKHSWLLSWFAFVLVAFLPQLAYLSVYVNNDIIAIAGVSIILYALVSSTVDIWKVKYGILLAVGIDVCLLGYLNSIPFVIVGIIYSFILIVHQVKTKQLTFKTAFRITTISILIVLFITLPFFIRNYLLYQDFTGATAFTKAYNRWLAGGGKQTMFPYHHNIVNMLYSSDWIITTFESSIGLFGYMNIKIKSGFYIFYLLFIYSGLQFLILSKLKKKEKKISISFLDVLNLLMLFAVIATIFLSAYRSVTTDFQAQGRYIMTILPIISVWICEGFYVMTKHWLNLKLKPTILTIAIVYVFIGIVIFTRYILINPVLVWN